jgi:magnesium-transporting ATPase (P-type)
MQWVDQNAAGRGNLRATQVNFTDKTRTLTENHTMLRKVATASANFLLDDHAGNIEGNCFIWKNILGEDDIAIQAENRTKMSN